MGTTIGFIPAGVVKPKADKPKEDKKNSKKNK